jgi:hypothetical protein
MTKRPVVQYQLWAGPMQPTSPRKAANSTRCVGVVRNAVAEDVRCAEWTINGDFLCYS